MQGAYFFLKKHVIVKQNTEQNEKKVVLQSGNKIHTCVLPHKTKRDSPVSVRLDLFI